MLSRVLSRFRSCLFAICGSAVGSPESALLQSQKMLLHVPVEGRDVCGWAAWASPACPRRVSRQRAQPGEWPCVAKVPPPAPPTPSSGSFLNNFRQQLLCSAHCLSLFRPPQSGSLSATDAIPRGSEAGSLGSGCPRSQPLLGHRLLVMSPMAEGQR